MTQDVVYLGECALEKKVYSSAFGWNVLKLPMRSITSNVSFKKIEIVSSIFSDHNSMRLDINYKKKTVKSTNTWRLNNTFLNNQQVTEEIKREIKNFLETNDK